MASALFPVTGYRSPLDIDTIPFDSTRNASFPWQFPWIDFIFLGVSARPLSPLKIAQRTNEVFGRGIDTLAVKFQLDKRAAIGDASRVSHVVKPSLTRETGAGKQSSVSRSPSGILNIRPIVTAFRSALLSNVVSARGSLVSDRFIVARSINGLFRHSNGMTRTGRDRKLVL